MTFPISQAFLGRSQDTGVWGECRNLVFPAGEVSFTPSLSEGLHGTALVCKSQQDERSLCGVGMTHFSAPKMLVLLTRKLPTYSEGFQCFLSFVNSSSCLLPRHSILLIRTSFILCHHLTTSSRRPNGLWRLEKPLGG